MSRTAPLSFILLFFALSIPAISHAQTMQCTTAEQKAACQAALNQALADEAAAQAQLTSAQGKSASLSQAIALLTAKINAAEADIKAKNILIQTLGSDISTKQNHISDLEGRIAAGKQTLADLLRKTSQLDAYSLPEVMLSQNTVTGFFNDVDTFQAVQNGLQNTFDQLQADEASTTVEKNALNVRLNATQDARYAIQQQEASVKSDQVDQKQLLSISKGNEAAYSSLVAQKAAQAAQIKAALFPLAGGGKAIPFGDAYQYSLAASKLTGVRPAFLLAILTQESNLGGNVGQCRLSDASSGAGINVKSGATMAKVMSPNRDVPPFLTLTKALGIDPYSQVVSCPQAGVVGWGGAMGPAQFIASTWALLEDRIASALGIGGGAANPWDPQQAIMGEALFMEDLGAGAGGYTAERNAACRYYAGGSGCTSVSAPYGNSVISLANKIQTTEINALSGF